MGLLRNDGRQLRLERFGDQSADSCLEPVEGRTGDMSRTLLLGGPCGEETESRGVLLECVPVLRKVLL